MFFLHFSFFFFRCLVVVVVLLFYVHGKHLRSCRDGGGWVVRWCWVSFQCRGVLLIWIRVRQGPTALAMGADGGCLDIFTLVYHLYSFPSLWETARYRLKYCRKGPFGPKNQPTNQIMSGRSVNLTTLFLGRLRPP